MAAARSGADPEPADSETGAADRLSFERREFARMRTASPSATKATTKP
jgi:hypothetical protein